MCGGVCCVQDANKPAEQLFGWSRSQLRLRNVLSLIAPDDQALLRPVLDAMRQRSRRAKQRRRAPASIDEGDVRDDGTDSGACLLGVCARVAPRYAEQALTRG